MPLEVRMSKMCYTLVLAAWIYVPWRTGITRRNCSSCSQNAIQLYSFTDEQNKLGKQYFLQTESIGKVRCTTVEQHGFSDS